MLENNARENKKRMDRLIKIWRVFGMKKEFILALKSVNALSVQWDDRIPTACVGFDKRVKKPLFKFNTQFFDKCTDEEILFVIAHETAHIVLEHIKQLIDNEEYKKHDKAWNIAADCIINDWLLDRQYVEGSWFYGTKFFCPTCGSAGCGDPDPGCLGEKCALCKGNGCKTAKGCKGIDCSDRTLRQVFEYTLRKFKENNWPTSRGGSDGEVCDGGENCPHKGMQPSSDGNGTPCKGYHGMGGDMVDDHGDWENQDPEAIREWIKNNVDDKVKQKFEEQAKEQQTVIENDDGLRTADTDSYEENAYSKDGASSNDAPSHTTIPGHIVGQGATFDLQTLEKVRANWRHILSEGTAMKEKLIQSWRRNPTVLLGNRGPYRLPYEQDQPLLRILIALDVSGSVCDRDKKLFFSCWRGIPRNSFDIRAVVFANRAAEIKYQKRQKTLEHDHVGGGTEFSAITDWIKTSGFAPDKIVVITDGGSHWRYTVTNPERYNFVIRCSRYEKDEAVDVKQLVDSWNNGGDKTDWRKATYFSFDKFAKILGSGDDI